MRILLTGATGYIGARLLPLLAEAGHEVVACVRSARRLVLPSHLIPKVSVIETDFLNPESLKTIPREIDAAYYLIHSMGKQAAGFSQMEAACAENFITAIDKTKAKQVIYLSGLSQGEVLSEHMRSRHSVEDLLRKGRAAVTVLRAGIIIGSGSHSFEIMRDLVEKLPVMVAPRWVSSLCQPIALIDVLFYLQQVLGREDCLGKQFEVGGPEQLTYREMLQRFAKFRGLKRWIIPVPLLTPYLSSLWLFLITSVNFSIAQALVKSLITDAICSNSAIEQLIPHSCLRYKEAIEMAFEKKQVPSYGCVREECKRRYSASRAVVLDRLFRIGGERGWYTMNWAWKMRGWIDRMVGGVGLRRGRRDPTELCRGDVVDFWRVLQADREAGYLLLYAEMRLPGEAWLEWKVAGDEKVAEVRQTAIFRPRGLLGRAYWYLLLPLHKLVFHRLCDQIGSGKRIAL